MISENNHYRTVFVVQAFNTHEIEWHDIREWKTLEEAKAHQETLKSFLYRLRIVQRTCEDLALDIEA